MRHHAVNSALQRQQWSGDSDEKQGANGPISRKCEALDWATDEHSSFDRGCSSGGASVQVRNNVYVQAVGEVSCL
jgi:hypothetical protein